MLVKSHGEASHGTGSTPHLFGQTKDSTSNTIDVFHLRLVGPAVQHLDTCHSIVRRLICYSVTALPQRLQPPSSLSWWTMELLGADSCCGALRACCLAD